MRIASAKSKACSRSLPSAVAGVLDSVLDFLHRQMMPDDAGGRREDLFGGAAKHSTGQHTHPLGIALAASPGACICIACVDDNGAEPAACHIRATNLHGRGDYFIGCEHRRGSRQGVTDEQADVDFAGSLDSRTDASSSKAKRGEEVERIHSFQSSKLILPPLG